MSLNLYKFINYSRVSVFGMAGGLGREHIPGQVLVPKLAITGFLLYFLKRLIFGQSPAKNRAKYSYSLSTTPSEQKTKETRFVERRVLRNAEQT